MNLKSCFFCITLLFFLGLSIFFEKEGQGAQRPSRVFNVDIPLKKSLLPARSGLDSDSNPNANSNSNLNSTNKGLMAQGLFGLEEIPFDEITELLLSKCRPSKRTKGENISTAGEDLTAPQKDLSRFNFREMREILQLEDKTKVFLKMKDLLADYPLRTEYEHYQLARYLVELREFFRLESKIKDLKKKREILFLLQMIQEEVLYFGFHRAEIQNPLRGTPPERVFTWMSVDSNDGDLGLSPPSKTEGGEENPIETMSLLGFPIQNGDVLLSKATGYDQNRGAGSSSLIALIGNAPHIFSHSTIAVIYPVEGERKLISPEADLADGVKLRAFEDYKGGEKTRLFIYRLSSLNAPMAQHLRTMTDRFVEKMYQRTMDPFKEAAYPYDFNLQPDSQEAFYCAAIPCRIYRDTQWSDGLNPYPRNSWGQPHEMRRLLYDFLEIPTKPSAAPGDLETNPRYHLVGSEVRLHRLEAERMDLAIIDSLFDLMTENGTKISHFVEETDRLGDQPITDQQIQFLVRAGVIDETAASRVPRGIKPKQMLFFGFLNEVFTPRIRALMQEQILERKKRGEWLGPQALRYLAYEVQKSQWSNFRKDLHQFVSLLKKAQKGEAKMTRSCKNSIGSSIKEE